MKIVCVNGMARAGKDLFCDYAFRNRGLVYVYSTIDKIKEIARQIGWNGEKDEKGRKFLSDLKDAMTDYDDLPRKYVLEEIKNRMDIIGYGHEGEIWGHDAVFLVHMREPKEIEKWENEHGARSLLINRKEADRQWNNHADDEVYNHMYHYVLDNNGTKEDLERTAIRFIDDIREEDWESHL